MKILKIQKNKLIVFLAFLAVFLIVFAVPRYIKRIIKKRNQPNIILISIDTLRADHLHCYGYERDTSPNIDKLSEESILFEKNFSQVSYSYPSYVSMLSSLYPLSHGAFRREYLFSENITTLAQALSKAGFKTTAFVGGGNVSGIQGFNRGFDDFSDDKDIVEHLPGVMDWLFKNKNNKFFLFFQFYDVHTPYVYRKEYKEMYHGSNHEEEWQKFRERQFPKRVTDAYFRQLPFEDKILLMLSEKIVDLKEATGYRYEIKEEAAIRNKWKKHKDYKRHLQLLIDSYDAGIKYTDNHLGRFFTFLKKANLWDDTLIIVTSDHGEEFMEHGILTHGEGLYDTLLHVPLIIKVPKALNISPRRVFSLTETVDIMPTVLDMLGIRFKGQMQGVSFLPLINGNKKSVKEAVFASLKGKNMIRTLKYKYIINNDEQNFSEEDEFYNLELDKEEQINLIKEKDPNLDNLKSMLKSHIDECNNLYNRKYSKKRKRVEDAHPPDILKQHTKKLKALGYLQ